MNRETLFVLAVALITWGGVFVYLLRLHFLTKSIVERIDRQNPKDPQ